MPASTLPCVGRGTRCAAGWRGRSSCRRSPARTSSGTPRRSSSRWTRRRTSRPTSSTVTSARWRRPRTCRSSTTAPRGALARCCPVRVPSTSRRSAVTGSDACFASTGKQWRHTCRRTGRTSPANVSASASVIRCSARSTSSKRSTRRDGCSTTRRWRRSRGDTRVCARRSPASGTSPDSTSRGPTSPVPLGPPMEMDAIPTRLPAAVRAVALVVFGGATGQS